MQAYGGNNDRRQSEIQHDLPQLLDHAAHKAGLDRSRWHVQAKGDEQLAVLPADESEPRVIDDYIRHVASGLQQYNRLRIEEAWLRLRASVHHGLVEIADNGYAGRTVVTTSRLLSSAVLSHALRAATKADLILALSNDVYDATVVGGHTTLSPDAFRPVLIHEKELRTVAWLWAPGDDVHRLDLGENTESRVDPQVPTSHSPRQRKADRPTWSTAEPSVPSYAADAAPSSADATEPDDTTANGRRVPLPAQGQQVSQSNYHGTVHAPGGVFGISNSHG
ncbi:hypothetical protein [Streptomyces albofaciens]|uniref:hypothetical protein n=1 Tax=Streptomyces albofaciens TaxID=66866 RepID=UPI001FCBC5E3|nr:hypothetical protein [Streptomyces albofaciens]